MVKVNTVLVLDDTLNTLGLVLLFHPKEQVLIVLKVSSSLCRNIVRTPGRFMTHVVLTYPVSGSFSWDQFCEWSDVRLTDVGTNEDGNLIFGEIPFLSEKHRR